MKITIKAHPRSNFEKIIEHEGVYHAYFNVIPKKGAANAKIIEMLSHYFKVTKSDINIVVGKTSPDKIIEFDER